MFLKHILDHTFYGYFNTYMAGITSFYFHENNGCIGFIILKTSKTTSSSGSIPFTAKDIAILRLSVTGGGHLECYYENVDEKN